MENSKAGNSNTFNLQVEKCKLEWKLPKQYQIVSILGQGAYGCVVEARDMRTNTQVAIKRIANLFKSQGDTKRNLREITLLRKLQHKTIIKLLDVIVEGDYQTFTTIYLVMEYFPSDLKKLLRSPIYLTTQHIALLSYNILLGMKYLHNAGVLHRDIKPANILINEDCDIKLCDFGLARVVTEHVDDQLFVEQQQIEKEKQLESKMQTAIMQEQLQGMSGKQVQNFQQKIDQIFEEPSKKQSQQAIQYETPKKEEDTENNHKIQEPRTEIKAHHKASIDDQVYEMEATQPVVKKQRLYSCDEQEMYSQKSHQFKRTPKRGLTRHVVTRWYRAPELILIEKIYDEKIDIWSFGCVFAELQGSLKSNVPNYKDRRAIFPGSSCFPLSPKKKTNEKQEQSSQLNGGIANILPKIRQDQLQMIISVIGTPSEDKIDFISDPNAKKYIQSFDQIKPLDLKQAYPGSDKEAIKIMEHVFKFNPTERKSIEELLTSTFFDQFRRKDDEISLQNVKPIEMELEFEEEITLDVIREYFVKEFQFYLQGK